MRRPFRSPRLYRATRSPEREAKRLEDQPKRLALQPFWLVLEAKRLALQHFRLGLEALRLVFQAFRLKLEALRLMFQPFRLKLEAKNLASQPFRLAIESPRVERQSKRLTLDSKRLVHGPERLVAGLGRPTHTLATAIGVGRPRSGLCGVIASICCGLGWMCWERSPQQGSLMPPGTPVENIRW